MACPYTANPKAPPLVALPSLSCPLEKSEPSKMATKMTSDLEKKFKKAVWLIRNGPPKKGTSTADKLKFYSLFKQATEGDCTGTQPWAVQVREQRESSGALVHATKANA